MNLELNLDGGSSSLSPMMIEQATDSPPIKALAFPAMPLTPAEEALHRKSIKDAKIYKVAEATILQDVCDIDKTKLYEKFGLTSTYAYCLEVMELSEFIAKSCIAIARKSKNVPELKEAIEDGQLTVSKAIRIVPILKQENKAEWLNKAKTLSKNKLERAVADLKPELKVVETRRPSSKGRSKLTVSFPEDVEDDIRRLQELESKPNSGFASIEQVVTNAIRDRVERIDPIRKAARATQRAQKKSEVAGNTNVIENQTHQTSKEIRNKPDLSPKVNPKENHVAEFVDLMELEKRDYLARIKYEREIFSAEIIHAINKRDRCRCKALLPDGTICDSGFWTQIHHIIEVKDGGTNDLENLITLCGNHHRQWHKNQGSKRIARSATMAERNFSHGRKKYVGGEK
jgi:hypothetical protein